VTSGLPAPLHFAPSFLSMSMFGMEGQAGNSARLDGVLPGYPGKDHESVQQWLKRTNQTELSIRHFWHPIVMATLNDSPERCSTRYTGKVFHEMLVKSSTGGRLGIPTVPLSEFYAAAARLIESNGGCCSASREFEGIVQEPDGRWRAITADATYMADSIILTLPFEQTQKLLPSVQLNEHSSRVAANERDELEFKMARQVHSPFTSILFWCDHEICDLDHAWLLDTTIEWFFHKSRIRRYAPDKSSYVELVIAGSKAQLSKTREEILSSALKEMEMFFPDVKQAKLLKSGVLKEARATFSVTTELDQFRPKQETRWPGLFLAGDWTATEWLSTMEGGVRSGRLAAGAAMGDQTRFMAAEIPASGLMRWLSRD
jgi:protoporphyrinogen oxidase